MTICFKCGQKTNGAAEKYGLHIPCFINWFELSGNMDFCDLDPKKTSTKQKNMDIEKEKDTFFHGQYLKYSASLNGKSYILKIQEDSYPDLPAMEYLCNKIAKALELDVPDFYLINFQGHLAFVTINFMQNYIGVLNHIYKFLQPGEEGYNCESIIEVILNQTGRLSEVKKFIEICLYDSLVGNNDRHGRNLGLIQEVSSNRLAPMYDNPSFLGILEDFMLGAHFNPSGSIWTSKSREPKPRDYIEEFNRLGYTDIVNIFINRLLKKKDEVISSVSTSYISAKRKTEFIKFIERRYGELTYAK